MFSFWARVLLVRCGILENPLTDSKTVWRMSQLPRSAPRSSHKRISSDIIDVDQYALDSAQRDREELARKYAKLMAKALEGTQVSPRSGRCWIRTRY